MPPERVLFPGPAGFSAPLLSSSLRTTPRVRGAGSYCGGKKRQPKSLPLAAKAETNVDDRDCVSLRFRPVAPEAGNPLAPGHVLSRHVGSGGSGGRDGVC